MYKIQTMQYLEKVMR